ncbi:ATP-dependent helicase [Rhodococcus fascians]|uniref:UvrD-helicase domain-containing protein n=1 Tax=Rhodococcoides fascians TaxID=1828 RepID=UPI001427A649|nr:ATP-dependent helicase [Rhodococcus fascians]MBM7242704.1 ATP-dependent helicase [Rhodococcus fascians]MBY3809200.1 ATP-dependent helicase [Rhodococcus fascians]MBY3840852.1 ATP-dependent helicase [Rhodococcus fascians]MBY3846371.1 ATP-dependent helicase [Rhodococcus fascians]MBY3851058.1 ATP-dependent helicase [Rhodococcus fascians]
MVVATSKQQEIRDHAGLDLLVIAPAGCGKTEALALRVQGLLNRGDVTAPQKVLVTTFSNRARDNIKERLKAYLPGSVMRDRVSVANFHGISVRLIRAHANVIGLKSGLLLPESDWVSEQLRIRRASWDEQKLVKDALQSTKLQALTDEDVAAELDRIGNVMASDIERQRKAEERLTYDDLPRLAELILGYPAIAELYRAHFGAVVVDEFQDLTLQQLRIVNHIGHLRTTYGGDLAQGIYGFAGAKPIEVDRAIRDECTTVIEFSESHRSSPAVLSLVNSLMPRTSGHLLTSADPASWPSGGLAGSVVHQTAEIEAAWIVKIARALLARAPNQRIGLIARTAPRRRFVDSAFEHADVPHFRWDDGVLDTDVAKLVKAMLTRFDLVGYEKVADKIAFLRNAAGVEAIADVDILKGTIDALGWVYDLLSESVRPPDIRRRIKIGDASTLVTSAGVHLLSGHVGKGQQFDWVVVVGVEEDFIPFSMADTPDEITEEARVLSVMISRARHGAILSRAASVPTNAGHYRARTASRFLTEINASGPLDLDEIIEWFRTVDWKAVAAR